MKPILFSTPMVQAIQSGRKTQTRRVIKSRHESGLFQVCRRVTDGKITDINSLDWDERNCEKDVTPRYQPGDILYVREAWRLVSWNWDDSEATIEFKDGEKVCFELDGDDQIQWLCDQVETLIKKEIYVSTNEDSEEMDWSGKPNPWKPSIHLPKYCSRIILQVTDVRAERLQDISEADAVAEGIEPCGPPFNDVKKWGWRFKDYIGNSACLPVASFRTLWDSINAKKCPWDSNPWVWVYSFKKIEKP
jgi:hypothetical protein